jgi:hypothetical protein
MNENELGAEPPRHRSRDLDRFCRRSGKIGSANNWSLAALFHKFILFRSANRSRRKKTSSVSLGK